MSAVDDISNAVRVYLGINSRGIIDNAFVLDDPTYGQLNGSPNTLGGTVWVDVTSYCSGQINTNAGRSREVDQFQAGTASFTLRNEGRTFDPSNTASTYYPNITPRLPVRISLVADDAPPIFTGYVDDIQVDYEMPNICTATFTCVDAFSLLANMPVDGLTVTAGLPGVVINQVLDYVGFPATRDINAGTTPIQASSPTGDALTYLQAVAASEDGWLYVTSDGVLRFQDRRSLSTYATFFQSLALQDGTFTSPNTVYRFDYSAIAQSSQALLLYNIVTGQRTGGATKTATNAASVDQYFARTLSLSTLESASDAEVKSLCQWLVGVYSTPEVRFSSASINLASSFAPTLAQAVKQFRLGQSCIVRRQPPGGGSDIQIPSMIEGVSYSLDVSGSSYTVDLAFGSLARIAGFTLDDATFGVLDSSLVAY